MCEENTIFRLFSSYETDLMSAVKRHDINFIENYNGDHIDDYIVEGGITKTALMMAVEQDNADIVRILVQKGANVNLANNHNKIAIDLVDLRNHKYCAETIECLIHKSVIRNISDMMLFLPSKITPNFRNYKNITTFLHENKESLNDIIPFKYYDLFSDNTFNPLPIFTTTLCVLSGLNMYFKIYPSLFMLSLVTVGILCIINFLSLSESFDNFVVKPISNCLTSSRLELNKTPVHILYDPDNPCVLNHNQVSI
jgi:hypothetical protein